MFNFADTFLASLNENQIVLMQKYGNQVTSR